MSEESSGVSEGPTRADIACNMEIAIELAWLFQAETLADLFSPLRPPSSSLECGKDSRIL